MPLHPICILKIFDCWGMDFMGSFVNSFGHEYILLAVNYVSKWVEAIPTRINDHKTVVKFLKENIFNRFGMPRAIISNGGSHFCNKPVAKLMKKYRVTHKVSTLSSLYQWSSRVSQQRNQTHLRKYCQLKIEGLVP